MEGHRQGKCCLGTFTRADSDAFFLPATFFVASRVRRFIDFIRGSQAPRQVTRHGTGKRASNLTPLVMSYQEWDIPDVSAALTMAEGGNMQSIGRIADALLSDGAIVGQLTTRFDGMLQLPRHIEGPVREYADALNEDFDEFCSPAELGLMARDGGVLNIVFGEILELESGKLKLVRRNPEFLTYRHNENRWYVRTREGQEPVEPGNGRWLLAFPHGTDYPWRYGIWQSLAYAFINRRQAFMNLNAWNNSMAFPIKKLTVPDGASEEEAQETFDAINHFGPFPAIRLNKDWDFDIVQPSSTTATSLKDAIEASEREVILTVSGQVGTTDGSQGFSNLNVLAKVKSDLVQVDAVTFAQALNEQVIPVWAQRRFSFAGWLHSPRVRWDTTLPKDRVADANAANMAASALNVWTTAIAASGVAKAVDVVALAEQYGVPLVDRAAVAPVVEKDEVPTDDPKSEPADTEKPAELVLAPTDLASIVTVNEAREAQGLGPIEDGNLTIDEYRAKHAQVIAAVTEAEGGGTPGEPTL